MGTTSPQKKRKVRQSAPHSKCRLHRNADGCEKFCNATTKNGEKCTARIKRANREAQLTAGHLPVCGVHKTVILHAGFCEATASCGERCNRRVPRLFGQHQRCYEHDDFALTCHFMRLPLELRMIIYDCVVPPQRFNLYSRQSQEDACAMMRVNKQLHGEISMVLFESMSRPCQASVSDQGFTLFDCHYNLEVPIRDRRGGHHMSESAEHRPERIRYLDVEVTGSRNLSYRDTIARIVHSWALAKSLITYVLLSRPRFFTITVTLRCVFPESHNVFNSMINLIDKYRRSRRQQEIAVCSVKFALHQSCGEGVPEQISKFLRMVRAVMHAMSCSSLRKAQDHFRVELQWSRYLPSGYCYARCYMHVTENGVTFSGNARTMSAGRRRTVDKEIESFKKWTYQQRGPCSTTTERSAWERRWNMLEKFLTICRGISLLGVAHPIAPFVTHSYCESDLERAILQRRLRSIDTAKQRLSADQMDVLRDRAMEAFCNQDDTTLQNLLTGMQAWWTKMNDRKDEMLMVNAVNNILQQPKTKSASREDIAILTVSQVQQRPDWPNVPPRIKVPKGQIGEQIDGVYERFMVEGKRVMRLIT